MINNYCLQPASSLVKQRCGVIRMTLWQKHFSRSTPISENWCDQNFKEIEGFVLSGYYNLVWSYFWFTSFVKTGQNEDSNTTVSHNTFIEHGHLMSQWIFARGIQRSDMPIMLRKWLLPWLFWSVLY